MRGGRIQIPLLAGHHRPASDTPFQWSNIECWLGSIVVFKGIQTSIAKEPYIFVIFQGGGSGPPVHFNLNLLIFLGMLQVLRFQFQKFRILDILSFHP